MSTNRVLGAFEGQPIKLLGYFQMMAKCEDLPSQTTVLSIYVVTLWCQHNGKRWPKYFNIVIDPQQFGNGSNNKPDRKEIARHSHYAC